MKLSIILTGFLASIVSAHFSITYPYWRGNSYPTQWTYPCGGVDQTLSSNNRTLWPLDGGALVFTPTHPSAQTYINLGLGNNVTRLNITLTPTFNQTGNGTFCFPQLRLPDGMKVEEGTNASVQVIQLSHNGGALYNCADITFSSKATTPDDKVCFNSTGVGSAPFSYDSVATTTTVTADGKNSSTGSSSSASSFGLKKGSGDGAFVVAFVAVFVVAGLMV